MKQRAAVILAGGRSTRFGQQDKAIAPLAGVPLIRRVINRISPVVDEIVVNCRDEQQAPIAEVLQSVSTPLRFAIDETPDRGPLAGIATGIGAVESAPQTFVVACDMPFCERPVVELLFELADGHDAAVPQLDDKWYQTTHAVFRTKPMGRASKRVLESGRDRIVHTFEYLDVVAVSESDIKTVGSLKTFENINTEEEFEAAAAAFSTDNA